MTLDDGGGGGGYGQMTSSKIAQFRDFLYLKKLFKSLNQTITQLFIVNSLYFSEITAVQVIRATEPKCCSHDNCFRN